MYTLEGSPGEPFQLRITMDGLNTVAFVKVNEFQVITYQITPGALDYELVMAKVNARGHKSIVFLGFLEDGNTITVDWSRVMKCDENHPSPLGQDPTIEFNSLVTYVCPGPEYVFNTEPYGTHRLNVQCSSSGYMLAPDWPNCTIR